MTHLMQSDMRATNNFQQTLKAKSFPSQFQHLGWELNTLYKLQVNEIQHNNSNSLTLS